jgi:Protein of unknown function (DUF3040)
MSLSPYEQRALAALEENLRADDPTFAAVLAAPAAPTASVPSALRARDVLTLLVALGGVITAGVLAAGRPAVLAVVTGALLVPWLVVVARSAARRAHRAALVPLTLPWARMWAAAGPRTMGSGRLASVVALLLAVLVIAPPTGRAVVGLLLTFVVAPWAAVHVASRFTRRKRS